MNVTRPRILVFSALTLTVGCATFQRAQDRRLAEWQASSISVDEATQILGTAPYAVPGLEIVAIHADRRSQVVIVEQRVEPGLLIGLSQHRGQYIPPAQRTFWVRERVSLERVPYTTERAVPDRYYEYVDGDPSGSAERRWRDRRLTRWISDALTIRIWAGRLPEQRQIDFLQSAEPIAN